MTCPLGLNVLATCPSKTPDKDPCGACRDDWQERSALIQFGGMGLDRAQSDALAIEQARASLPGQRTLV